MGRFNRSIAAFLLVFAVACGQQPSEDETSGANTASGIPAAENLSYTLINAYPHDTAAFTQGLEVYKGRLMESTGLMGRSSLRQVDINSGKVLREVKLKNDVFAEGITILRDTLYQLSWQNHEVYLYDTKKDLKLIKTLPWSGEGWGITHDDQQLIISDGSDKLYFVEPSTLKLKKVLSVRDQYGPVNNLNELEMIDGTIYANRWQYEYIIRIDPVTGYVTGTLGMQDFLKKNSRADLRYLDQPGSTAQQSGAVLNGIAYNPEKKTVYITGKLWPEVFEIRLNPSGKTP